jgi:integration host factor subunit alpha
MTVTKQDLTSHLVDSSVLNHQESKKLVECFFDTVRRTLASGEEVKLSGFGQFVIRDKRARPGRNPKTGVPVEICARRVVNFRASALMKDKLSDA